MRYDIDTLFDRRSTFPDFDAQDRWNRVVGLDSHKSRLAKMLGLLVNPSGIQQWMGNRYPGSERLVDTLLRRPPLIVLAGDVGCGKTELAETVGDRVARQENIEVTLFPMSLSARGEGRVGEMTQLLSAAFDATAEAADQLRGDSGKASGAVVLLVDEGDAIAQSRDAGQMHHEDRAGVNAFIRGVDKLARAKLPAAVILCTNRLNSLDPAVKRRAADVLTFTRPGTVERQQVLLPILKAIGFDAAQAGELVKATGASNERNYGYTYSDILQRLIPAIVLDAYPEDGISADRAIELAKEIVPTAPFRDRPE